MPASPQQQAIIDHPVSEHGRVLAGPGTGKSWAAVSLLQRIADTHPTVPLRLLTFTRAATAELAQAVLDLGDEDGVVPPPSTIHSFSLSLLMRNAHLGVLPQPLRIPDKWELNKLIHPFIARRLRGRGFSSCTVTTVEDLEQEMAAGWESLDPGVVLLSDVDEELRNAYVGYWQEHRSAFGYCLLAELPFRAAVALQDYGLEPGDPGFLIVDEYQDLNLADIRLIRLLADRGFKVLAIGDDDQSIYGFRMAAPQGIRNFPRDFQTRLDYPLTESRRCAGRLLDAPRALIETAPDRIPKPRLTAHPQTAPGYFGYARFPTANAETAAVARMVAARIRAGVDPGDIVVLVRSNLTAWTNALAPALVEQGVEIQSSTWVREALARTDVRRGLAIARLAISRADSLAWWTLITVSSGINAEAFVDYIYNARQHNESFADCLLRLYPEFTDAPTRRSADAARDMLAAALSAVAQLDTEGVALDETGWGGWLVAVCGDGLPTEVSSLITAVGANVDPAEGLGYFLSQLQPVGEDLATSRSSSVRLMTMTSSKGLTVDTAFVLGVEKGLVPLERPGYDLDEERRLLYVAMTRAKRVCVLTCVARRSGATSYLGQAPATRGRSPLLENLPIGQWTEGDRVVGFIEQLA